MESEVMDELTRELRRYDKMDWVYGNEIGGLVLGGVAYDRWTQKS